MNGETYQCDSTVIDEVKDAYTGEGLGDEVCNMEKAGTRGTEWWEASDAKELNCSVDGHKDLGCRKILLQPEI